MLSAKRTLRRRRWSSAALAAIVTASSVGLARAEQQAPPQEPLQQPAAANPPEPFHFSADAVRLAKETAARELAQRFDLKSRRPTGLEAIDSPAQLESVIDQAIWDLGVRDRADAAAERLRYLGPAALIPLVEALLRADFETRRQCAVLLAHHGSRAVRPLEKALTQDLENVVRAAAAESLGRTFDPAAVPLLVAALEDRDHTVRTSAVRALVNFRDPATLEPLSRVRLLRGSQDLVDSAIRDIGSPPDVGPATVPAELLDVYQLARDAETLAGEKYGPQEIDQLLAHIDSHSWWVAGACHRAIAHLDAREAVPEIIDRGTPSVKYHYLAQLATPESIDFLVASLESQDKDLQSAAVDGLRGGGRWTVPLLVELLDDPALSIPETLHDDPRKAWPADHRAKGMLFQVLYDFGLPGNSVNLAGPHEPPEELPREMDRIKAWWAEHAQGFLEGKAVPNPQINIYGSHS